MKLRSNKVFKSAKPKIDSKIKNEGFISEKRLSLRSSKSIYGKSGEIEAKIGSLVDNCDENLEMGMKKTLNSDDKVLFLEPEVLDSVKDSVVSCPEVEYDEEEEHESMSMNLSETGLDFNEQIKSSHVDCENGSKSLESETIVDDTTIVNGDDNKETSLNDLENGKFLGKCKETKEKERRGRKKKNVGNLKKIESNQEKIDVVISVNDDKNDDDDCTIMDLKHESKRKRKDVRNLKKNESNHEKIDVIGVNDDDDDECTIMHLKHERNRKRKNVENLKKIENNQEKIDDAFGVNDDDHDDECTIMPLKHTMGMKRKNVEASGSECNVEAKKAKVEKDSIRVTENVSRSNDGPIAMVYGGVRAVVLGLKRLDEEPNTMLKRHGRPHKVFTEYENTRPKKKLKKRGRPRKRQGEITIVPSSEIPMKKVERRGRPRKCQGEITIVPSGEIPMKKLERRGRPRKRQGEITIVPSGELPMKKIERRGRPRKRQGEITIVPSGELPMKKLERRGRPRKRQGEITIVPSSDIPMKKLKHHGRRPKVSHEKLEGPMKLHGIKQNSYKKGIIFKQFKRRGRPPKMEARTLAANVVKMKKRVKKSPKVCKNGKFEINGGKIIRGRLYKKQLKQLIREKISEILLKCGWKVDFRQRQERSYLDSVYIEPNGKNSHWSITGAYAKLKKKIENGNADDNELSAFTQLPEEEISMLFRQRNTEPKKEKKKILKNVKKGKIVNKKKKKNGKKKVKDGAKRKMIFKPRGLKEDHEGILVIKKLNLLSWMIDLGVILAGTKVQYGKTRRQKKSSEGVVTSDGICCGCCNGIMGLTEFVGHCGGQFGQVFDNLYLENGTCLRKCLMDSWRKEEELNIKKFNIVDVNGDDPNDDTCNICGDGGNLICCDGCPSTFHQSCLDVQNFPSGDWNCIYCTCKFCGVVSDSTPQVEETHDAITSHMLSCCLCEEKFHQLCVQEVEDDIDDSNKLPFCGKKCEELFERLQTFLGVKHELEDGFSWTLLQRSDVDQDFHVHDTQSKVEQNSKLAIAFSVMDECFVPILDERSGTNIIRNVIHNCGSNFKRLNYAGFLTAVLEKGDEFITVASIRIHGYRLAEMPFIGTRHMYRRQGMCRRLLDAIESTLSFLGVEELIIPAIPALMQTWTNVFGFMPIEESKRKSIKHMSMMVFPGIDMLKKPLNNHSADVDHASSSAEVLKDVNDHEQKEETNLIIENFSIPDPNDENNPEYATTSSNDENNPENKQTSNGVNNLCDLNLPANNILQCDANGQTPVDSESFPDCTIEPESSELILDAENDGVLGVKVKPLTSNLVLKNMFDLNLHPTAVETDVHIVSDDSVHCESMTLVDQTAGGQTDSKTCESQPLVSS